jgi:putative transposase
VSRRNFCVTTVRDERARPAADLVDRCFEADAPDKLWVADITYVPTWAGFLFLAVVIDVWSRRVVGWSMAMHLKTDLVLAALEMAVAQRQPRKVVHHSDQGTQYTSVAFGQRCKEAGVQPSMGSVGDAYDNTLSGSASLSVFLRKPGVRTTRPPGLQVSRQKKDGSVSIHRGWYNPRRRHSALDYQLPFNYERKHLVAA